MSRAIQAASVALFSGPAVLIIQRAFAPMAGHWSLPGGRAEPGETLEQCVRREIAEELSLAFGDMVRVETRSPPGFELTVFAAHFPTGASPIPNTEISDWRWWHPGEDLPQPTTDGLAGVLERARHKLG